MQGDGRGGRELALPYLSLAQQRVQGDGGVGTRRREGACVREREGMCVRRLGWAG